MVINLSSITQIKAMKEFLTDILLLVFLDLRVRDLEKGSIKIEPELGFLCLGVAILVI